MTSNNKKNRPADAQPKPATAKPAVPATATTYSYNGDPSGNKSGAVSAKAEKPVDSTDTMATAPAEAADTEAHPLDKAMDTFVAACAAYVDKAKSNRSTVVGPYRLAFNGSQIISVTHV